MRNVNIVMGLVKLVICLQGRKNRKSLSSYEKLLYSSEVVDFNEIVLNEIFNRKTTCVLICWQNYYNETYFIIFENDNKIYQFTVSKNDLMKIRLI